MDTVYPEPTSLLYRRPVRKKLRGNAIRYRTQPVTFAEIQVNIYQLFIYKDIFTVSVVFLYKEFILLQTYK